MRARSTFRKDDFYTIPYLDDSKVFVDKVIEGQITERYDCRMLKLERIKPVAYCICEYSAGAGVTAFAVSYQGMEVARARSSSRSFIVKDLDREVRRAGYEPLWPFIGEDVKGVWVP